MKTKTKKGWFASIDKDFMITVIAPIALSLIIGICSASFTSLVLLYRMEEQMKALQKDIFKHEEIIDKDLERYSDWMYKFIERLEDLGKRLAVVESINQVQTKSLDKIWNKFDERMKLFFK